MTESDEVSLKKRDIKQHYQREEVQQIIRKSADYKGFHKAGKCDDIKVMESIIKPYLKGEV